MIKRFKERRNEMKKNKLVHIAITSIMLLSTVLTPQMSHAIASMQAEEADESTQVEPSDVDAVNEDAVNDIDDGSNDGDIAEVVDVDSENEPEEAEDDPVPAEDDEVADETPEDINNNDPPVEEEIEEENVETDDEDQVKPLAEEGKDLGNIFEFDYLKLDGEDIKDGQIIEIEDGTKVAIHFEWHTQGRDAKAGDWATMELPAIFKEANVSNQPLIVDGINVGTYSIVGRELKLEFDEEIERDDVKDGYVGLSLEFDLEKFKENIEQEIHFNDSKDTTLNVIAKPKGEVSSIVKEGHPDNQHDAKEITWTIDVLNADEEEITKAMVKDNIPEGLKLKEGSLVVKELTIGYEGNKDEGREVTVNPKVTENTFEI